jgi:hypothetical protein
MLGEQRLVGRDDGFRMRQRRFDRRAGRAFVAADQLDEQVDLRRFGQFDRVVEPGEAGQRDAASLPFSRAETPVTTIGRPMPTRRGAESIMGEDTTAREHASRDLRGRDPRALCLIWPAGSRNLRPRRGGRDHLRGLDSSMQRRALALAPLPVMDGGCSFRGAVMPIKIDHCVIHVADWARSAAFYRDVIGAEVVPRGAGFAFRFGDTQLNCHGPGVNAVPLARVPVAFRATATSVSNGRGRSSRPPPIWRAAASRSNLAPCRAMARKVREPASISAIRTAR